MQTFPRKKLFCTDAFFFLLIENSMVDYCKIKALVELIDLKCERERSNIKVNFSSLFSVVKCYSQSTFVGVSNFINFSHLIYYLSWNNILRFYYLMGI